MRQSLELKLGQRLALTPQLQQAIKLLQLSATDLRQEMQEALEQNPLLEEADDFAEDPPEATPEETTSTGEAVNGEDHESVYDDGQDAAGIEVPHSSPSSSMAGDAAFDIDQRNSVALSLRDYLTEQMGLTPFSAVDQEIATAIIDAINDDGYLCCDLQEIQEAVGVEAGLDEIEAVLHQVQNYEPLGVGARDLKECLSIQLRQTAMVSEDVTLAREIVNNHLECLGSRDLAQLKKRTRCSEQQIRRAVELIQGLNPKPGTAVASSTPDYVIPDVVVSRDEGGWRVELNPHALPRIRVNDVYNNINRDRHTSDYQYIQTQLQEARWFVKSLENRNDTLLRVAREIVKRQTAFLEHGETAMKPMVLSDISGALSLHESTISRATTSKYMLTPRGVFELKYFFSSGLSTSGGDMTSATAIQSRIRRLINEEPSDRPYSDSKLTQLLNEEGINVARRTVAKYRESLNIPSSSQRKSL